MIEFKLMVFSKYHALQSLEFKGETFKREFKGNKNLHFIDSREKSFLEQIKERGLSCEDWEQETIDEMERTSTMVIFHMLLA